MHHFIIPWEIVFTALFKVPQAVACCHCQYGYLLFFFHWWIAVKCKIKFCILSELVLLCFHNEIMV